MNQFLLEPGWIDCHCHLADKRFRSNLIPILKRAKSLGIGNFLQGGVGPDDWQNQSVIEEKGIHTCFGLHPYWVASHSHEDCLNAYAKLKCQSLHSIFLGEIGLDFRTPYLVCGKAHQLEFFQKQLNLVHENSQIAVLHVVRAHYEVIPVLKKRKMPLPFLVHAFNAPWKIAQEYLSLGGYLSVGGALCSGRNHNLREAIANTPGNRLLIESDSPDQKPEGWREELNHPETIFLVAQCLSELKGGKKESWLDKVRENFLDMLGEREKHANH